MNKAKKIIKNWRIILLIITLVLAVVAIHPSLGNDGVAIRSVMKNSSAAFAGIMSPLPTDKPMQREVIKKINGIAVHNVDDYVIATSNLQVDDLVRIETTKSYIKEGDRRKLSLIKHKGEYTLTVLPLIKTTILNETELKTFEETREVNKTINGSVMTVNETINVTREVPKILEEVIGVADIGLKVYEAPTTNIKKGLDLQGGTRVLLQPEKKLESKDTELVIDNLKQRLNVYGLSDIVIREASDLPPPLGKGNQYIIVEIAGANEEEVRELIGSQGKFEAKIGNETVFRGGQDIKFVCRSSDCSFVVDPGKPCQTDGQNHFCTFSFSITLSQEAAEKQAELTRDLEVITEDSFSYLSKKLELFLDNEKVDELRISEDLKGKPVTQISISGPGSGKTRQEAIYNSGKSMKRLQTILVTGSLPVKLEVIKTDAISPLLGKEFVKNALLVGALAILAVAVVVFIRYRSLYISIPMMITMLSEVILLLGLAALIGWNLDLAAIAGILIAVGTGVDHQIVITDETTKGKKSSDINWKDKLKGAFYIIIGAYLTTVVAMLPLWGAGAGLLKGFAITTIFGVSFGVFITRPAFAVAVENLLKD